MPQSLNETLLALAKMRDRAAELNTRYAVALDRLLGVEAPMGAPKEMPPLPRVAPAVQAPLLTELGSQVELLDNSLAALTRQAERLESVVGVPNKSRVEPLECKE